MKFLIDQFRFFFKELNYLLKNAAFINLFSFLKSISLPLLFHKSRFIAGKNSREIQKEIFFNQKFKPVLESLLDISFLMRLLRFVYKIKHIKGDIIELGSYKAGTSVILAHYLKKNRINKLIFSCDTFEGHPYDDKHGIDVKGSFKSYEISKIESKFKRFGLSNNIHIIKGRFEDTLNQNLKKNKFSLAFIDCDLYQCTKYSLNFVVPRMPDESVIVFHDYRSVPYGLTKPVHNFCKKKRIKSKYISSSSYKN